MESQAASLETIAVFFETLDAALVERLNGEQRVTPSGFIRAYAEAAASLEEPEDGNPEN
jgi:hypothetical protein